MAILMARDMAKEPKLYPEDQAKVDEYLRSGYNETERKPFKPLRMMLLLLVVVTSFSVLSIMIARLAGVY